MNQSISPKYQMDIVQKISTCLFEQFRSYENVETYLSKWHQEERGWNNFWENFQFYYRDEAKKKIDAAKTLHNIDGETLLKIAIDLGIETPDYIPSIPTFKNELMSSYETASLTFEKAFRNVEIDPSLAIGLANSALESIIKEILKDSRINVTWSEKETLTKLIGNICKAFGLQSNGNFPKEIKTLASSLINAGKAIEDLRSDKTEFHGKTDGDLMIEDAVYAYFVVNATTTVGLFLLNFYKSNYPPVNNMPMAISDDGLPF
ncbi:abortive infection family protein [Porphyromonas gingivalis]|uniref:Abortive infection family protein n=1 Tax=Porphyromonas gingivalis TaxID=837 RepID=A0AAE9X6H3_PORGN|nr:abortive infection family protein [Porphyromonas gingivalis]WCF98094.1 abortive infection family protein [Porphyromonas gingivalis]